MSLTSFSFFDLVMIGLALYVFIAGVRGKGKLYDTTNIKDGMEEKYVQTMRIFYLGLGLVMALNSVCSILMATLYTQGEDGGFVPARELGAFSFLTPKVLAILSYVMFGLIVVGVILMITTMRKFIDKEKQTQQNSNTPRNSRQAGHTLPVDAFDFDETGDFVPEQEDTISEEEAAFLKELAAKREEE